MLIVRYTGEADRKRLEYVLEKYRDRIRVLRPSGAVLLINGDNSDIKSFLEDLYSRIPRENIEFYKLSEPNIEIEEKRSSFEVRIGLPPEEVWGAIGLIMARMKGSLISSVSGSREYIIRPRGGYARVRIHVAPHGRGSLVRVFLEGYGGGLERVASGLISELRLLGEVSGGERV